MKNKKELLKSSSPLSIVQVLAASYCWPPPRVLSSLEPNGFPPTARFLADVFAKRDLGLALFIPISFCLHTLFQMLTLTSQPAYSGRRSALQCKGS